MRKFHPTHLAGLVAALTLAPGCAPAPQRRAAAPSSVTGGGGAGTEKGGTADPMQGAPREALAWAPFDPATFARARAEHRFVVLDGAAEWCHWCHVMESTTYHDPAVRDVIARRFIAAKVDVDARPDIEERYGAYGWPATVIFSPEGEELGKYRGYIAPESFVAILSAVARDAPAAAKSAVAAPAPPSRAPLAEEHLAWIGRLTELELGEYYDADDGGWGKTQKTAIASDNAWALERARAGDAAMKERVLFTLDRQRALIDPVWGGIYQYSAASDWDHPHFEKLMTFQAGALDNYAAAYALTRDPTWLATARAMRGYIDRFLTGPDGGFYTTQDADLNAHDASARFMNGHDYYPLDDAHRRALGVPRVDAHEYGKENGLAIAAYVSFYAATEDATALASAERAARRVLATHATARGGISHDVGPKPSELLHLADNAFFGLALARLHETTRKPEYLDAATRIADFMLRELEDAERGGFFASTADPDAVGVFAARRTPFEENVAAIRFLARLDRITRDARYERGIAGALRVVATPEMIKSRGRMLGDFLSALEETRGVRGAGR